MVKIGFARYASRNTVEIYLPSVGEIKSNYASRNTVEIRLDSPDEIELIFTRC